jgi:hypothetical protein
MPAQDCTRQGTANSAQEHLDGLCPDLTLGLKVSLPRVKGGKSAENPEHLDHL